MGGRGRRRVGKPDPLADPYGLEPIEPDEEEYRPIEVDDIGRDEDPVDPFDALFDDDRDPARRPAVSARPVPRPDAVPAPAPTWIPPLEDELLAEPEPEPEPEAEPQEAVVETTPPAWLRVAAVTNTGLVRTGNEDTIGVGPFVSATPMSEPVGFFLQTSSPQLLVVCDGLGGHEAGEIASAQTCSFLASVAASLVGADVLQVAIERANRRLFDHMALDQSTIGMGCTIAAALLVDGQYAVANVGDARAYLLVGSHLTQLSIDDSLLLGADAGASTGTGFVITQCLGGGLAETPIMVHVLEVPSSPAAAIVLCSDGLSDMVEQEALEALVVPDDDLATVRAWLAAALEAGGRDNISIILARPV